MYTRSWEAIFGAIGIGLILAACGSGDEGKEVRTPEESMAEVQTEASRMTDVGLVLPNSEEWPVSGLIADDLGGEPVVYFPGYGTLRANDYWRCRWEAYALEASGAERTSALEQLESYVDLPAVNTFATEGLPSFEESLDKAMLGDMTALQADSDLNCGYAESAAP